MIERDGHIRALRRLFSNNSVVLLLGARGAGKSTLAREFAQRDRLNSYFFDLRSATDRMRLDDPALALSGLEGLVVLDEIHHAPQILGARARVVREVPDPGAVFDFEQHRPERVAPAV